MLAYDSPIQWDVCFDPEWVDINGNRWWDDNGVIVAIGDQLYLRAHPEDLFMRSAVLVNIETGDLFDGQTSNGRFWSFAAWRILLPRPNPPAIDTLLEYRAAVSKHS